MEKDPAENGWLRLHQLAERYPVFSEGAWKAFVGRGLLWSCRPAGRRARLIRVSDVERFLRGEQAIEREGAR